jgi:TP901 family phage tail tape measure protein
LAEQNPNLGLDASQFFSEIDKVDSRAQKINATLSEVARRLGETGDSSIDLLVKVRGTDEAFNKFSATLTKTEEEVKILGKQLTIETDAFGRNIQAVKEADVAYNQLQADILKADRAVAGFIARGEQDRRARVLAEQQALYNKLEDDAKRLAQFEQDRLKRLNDQLSITKALQAAQNKASDDNLKRIREERLAQAAGIAGQRLSNQNLSPTSANTILASPAEKQRVAQNIAQVQALISSGAISAKRALAVMDQAAAGSTEVFNGAEGRVARLAINLQNNSGKLGASYRKTVDDMNAQNAKAAQSFRDARNAGEQAATRIVLSWRDVARILAIQALHTVIRAFVNELRTAVDETARFQIRISEIRTISQDNQQSFDRWSSSVRNLSDQFGNPLLDVAEGTYEAISNQITKGAESAEFMAKALKFSQVTVSTTADSVNLLSSVLNAYKLGLNDVDRVSAQLFRTIDLGRVRASDLANELGRITPVAAALGISFEEVQAAIATITIQGVTPSETLTSIFAIMNKLLKPTKDMQKFMTELGFANGQAAIAALGFDGVLRKIVDSAQAGNHELADLFNEIRSTRGIVAVTRALDQYGTTLNSIRTDSQEKFNQAALIVNESAGKQFEIEINKIKNIFSADFAQPFLDSLTSIGSGMDSLHSIFERGILGILQIFGGLKQSTDQSGKSFFALSDVARSLISSLTLLLEIYATYRALTITATFATYAFATAQRNAAIATRLFGSNLLGLGGPIVAVTRQLGLLRTVGSVISAFQTGRIASGIAGLIAPIGALGAGYLVLSHIQKTFADQAAKTYDELTTNLSQQVQKQNEVYIKAQEFQQQVLAKALTNRLQQDNQYTAKARVVYSQLADAQEKRQKEISKRIRDLFDLTIKDVEDKVKKLEEQTREAGNNIKKAQEALFGQQEELTSGRFNRKLKLLPEPEQISAMFREIERLQKEAAAKLNAPTSDANVAGDNLKKATELQHQADRITNDLLEKQADLAKKRKDIEEQITKFQIQEKGTDNVRAQRENVEAISKLQKEAQAASGKRKSDLLQELGRRKDAAREELQNARDTATDENRGERLKELQAELDSIDAQQKKLGSTQDLENQINVEMGKRKTIYDAFIAAQKKIEDSTAAAARKERERLENLRTAFADLAKFKLPDIKSADDAKKALATFDNKVKFLNASGLTDQNVLFQIAQQRVDLEKKANLEIQKHTLDTNVRTLEETKVKFLKNLDDLKSANIKAANDQTAAKQLGFNTLAEVKAFFPSQTKADAAASSIGIPTAALQDFNAKAEIFTKALDSFAKSPSLTQANLLQGGFERLILLMTQRAGAEKPEDVIVKPNADPSQQVTLLTLQKQFQKAITDQLKAPGEQAKLAQESAAANQKIAQLGLDLVTAQKQLQDTTGNQLTATKNLTTEINNSATSMQQLITATRLAADNLIKLGQTPVPTFVPPVTRAGGGPVIPFWSPRGTDTIPAMLSPYEYVVRASAAKKYRALLDRINYFSDGGEVTHAVSSRSFDVSGLQLGNTNIGDIHIHGIPVSGNVPVDAKAMGRAIRNEIRLGTVSSFPTGET